MEPKIDARDPGPVEPDVAALLGRFRAAVGDGCVVIERPEVRRLYARDLGEVPAALEQTLFRTLPDLVAQPRSIEDVAKAVRFAHEEAIPIVPRGVASWGFGGCVPTRGGIVFDFSAWQDVGELDTDADAGTVAVAPGARWGEVEKVLRARGFTLGVYPSNRFATVGGWIATGGYGLMSGGHGHVRDWIDEITVVAPTGTKRLRRGEQGFELFFGSEGQLGVLAGAVVRGRPRPRYGSARLVLAQDGATLLAFVRELLAAGVKLAHAKLMDGAHMAALATLWRAEGGHAAPPLPEPRDAALLYFEDEAEEARFGSILEKSRAQGLDEAPYWVGNYLWEDRFNPLRVQLLGPSLLASESVVPIEAYGAYLRGMARLGRGYGATIYMEAHLVKEGGGHRLLLLPMIPCDRRDGRRYAALLTLVSLLTRLGIKVGGRPYGVGIWNTPFARQRFGATRLAELAAEKRRVDPRAVLNPGKMFGIGSSYGGLTGLVLHPAFVTPGLALLDRTLPLLGGFVGKGRDGSVADPGHYPETMEESAFAAKTLLGCTQCGNCVVVCPAYQVTLHEGTTARAKLRLLGELLEGREVTGHESDTAFICTHCGECERVCQTHLPLVRAWDVLEARLAGKHGRPEPAIRAFVDGLGGHPAYLKMIGSTPYRSGAPQAGATVAAPTWVPRIVASGKWPATVAADAARGRDPWARIALPKPRPRE